MVSPYQRKQKSPKQTNEAIQAKFEAELLRLASSFLSSKPFRHAQTKGNEREKVIRDFFFANLPKCYDVITGEVLDAYNHRTGQLDLVIYNADKNLPLFSGSSSIITAEAALVTIEVKSRLTRSEMLTSVRSATGVKRLQPFGLTLTTAHRRDKATGKSHAPATSPRMFHAIFAFDTDLVESTWARTEFDRYISVADEVGCDHSTVERIYVANRGLLLTDKSVGMAENPSTGEALMRFYLDVYKFLVREDERRPRGDFSAYVSKKYGDYQKFK